MEQNPRAIPAPLKTNPRIPPRRLASSVPVNMNIIPTTIRTSKKKNGSRNRID
jgi:hypothetical protein